MADRLVTETEASQRKRIFLEAAQNATSASAESAAPPKAEEPKASEAVAVAKDLAKGAVGAAKGFGQGIKGPAAASAETMEGVYDVVGARKAPGVEGDTSNFENVMQGLKRTVMGALGMPMAVLSLPGETLAGAIEGIRPGSLDVEVLSHGGTIRDFTSGPPDPKNTEAMRHHHGPMTAREALQLVGLIGTGAALHGAAGKAKPKVVEKPVQPSKTAAPTAPKSKGPVEPPVPKPIDWTKATAAEGQAYAKAVDARMVFEKQQKAAAPVAVVEPTTPGSPLDAAISERRSATPGEYTGPERRAVHEGTVPPAEALGIKQEPIVARAEGLKPDAAEAAINAEMGIPASGAPAATAGPQVTLFRHGKPEGMANFGESQGMVSPFRGAGPLHSVTMDAAMAEGYRKSNILKDPNADPAVKARIEQEGGMPDREFLLPEEQSSRAAEYYREPIKPAEEPAPTGNPKELSPLDMDPLADTEAVGSRPAPEAMPVKPDPFLEGTEAAGARPEPMPTNTVADLHAAAAPLIEQVAVEAKAQVVEGLKALTEARVREEANVLAAEMRAQGATRKEINEAYRAKLNEHGIKSKKQQAAETATDLATPAPEDASVTLSKIRASIAEITRKLDVEGGVELARNAAEGDVRLQTAIQGIAARVAQEAGTDVVQALSAVQASTEVRGELQRVMNNAQDPAGRWKPGWDLDRLDAELTKVTDAMAPFDRLLLNRLGPAVEAVRQGDMTGNGDALTVRKATMAMIENKAQPEAAATVALQGLGMEKGAASKVVTNIADAYRASGLADETGSFNFWKKAEDVKAPYDKAGAETVMAEKVTTHGVKEILRWDLNKTYTEAQVGAAKTARDSLFVDLQRTMDLMHDGVELPPGQLFHTATLAGAVADKARSAANRWGPDREPGRIVGGETPIGSKRLTDFGEALHAVMTEPELYAKLRSLDPGARAEWLGNTYRAGKNAKGLYMTLYMNSLLSSPYTMLKATAGDASTLPLSVGNRFLAEQWGRGYNGLENMGWLTKSDKHVVPGESAQLAMNYWENMKDQVGILSRRDWDGIHQQMVDAGEYRPPIANPTSLAGSIVNAVAGAPSSFLGAERSSHMVISRLGELRAQAWRQATLEGRTGVDLKTQTEYYQRNPTKDMMDAAINFAEENAFTRRMDGVFAGAVSKLTSRSIGKVLIDPFANITMNIMDYTMQGTPGLNLLSKRWRAEFNQGGAARDMAMGKLSMGTLFIGTAAYMGSQGLVTGDGPRDHNVRKIWEQAGWRSNYIYSPITGKPLVSHLALGPISGWLAAGADMAFMLRHADKQSAETLVAGTVMAMLEPLSHAGYIEVISDVTRGITNGISDPAFWRMVRNKAGAMALVNPGILRAASEIEDFGAKPMSTTPRAGSLIERELKMLYDDVMKQKPGWSENFPQMRNFITGKAVPRDGAAPWYHEVTSNKIATEIDRLGQNEGKGAKFAVLQPPSFIGGQMPKEGPVGGDPSPYEAIRLESWEKDRLIQLLTEKPRNGMTLEQRLENLIGSAKYKRYEDGQYGTKAMAIQSVYHTYVYAAQQDLLKEDKHLHWLVEEQKVRQARALGKEVKNPLGAMPEPTKYPRPGQKERP